MGYPEPLCSVLHGVEASSIALHEFGIGDPAGRAEGADWWDVVGSRSKPVAYLAYIAPRGLTEVGKRMEAEFKARTGREPTFVALEGYDSILVLAHAFRRAGTTEPRRVLDSLRFSEVPGTRGTIRFSTDQVGASAVGVATGLCRGPCQRLSNSVAGRVPMGPRTGYSPCLTYSRGLDRGIQAMPISERIRMTTYFREDAEENEQSHH